MRVVCISDTHGEHAQVRLPAGDVLVHAGDITAHGSRSDFQSFLDWFAATDFRHRIFVAGNHDTFLEQEPDTVQAMLHDVDVCYLNDSGVLVDGLQFWGSPITPRFHDWAFMRDPGEPIQQHWNRIPDDTDVLITHGPPYGILDQVERSQTHFEHTGCESLLTRIEQIKPKWHVFGHIHEAHGAVDHAGVHFLNVSTMNRHYQIANAPVIVDIDSATRRMALSQEAD